jgi:hypothetical protein
MHAKFGLERTYKLMHTVYESAIINMETVWNFELKFDTFNIDWIYEY